jgi:lipopolysaccharide biosynthesis glycosyltransferase
MAHCIVVAADQRYVRQACVTISSYALSNTLNRSDIFVLVHQVDAMGLDLLKTTASAFGLKLGIIPIDLSWTSKLPDTFRAGMGHVSPMTYFKLIAAEYIPSIYTKCLLLDSDLLVVGKIDALLSFELGEFAIGAVPDFMMPEQSGNRLGLKNPKSYFNCGVLLVDIQNWKKHAPLLRLPAVVEEFSSRICYGDQDILNIIFENAYLDLGYKYNHMTMVNLSGSIPNQRLVGQHPAILHFPGQIKPWHEYAPRNLQAVYFRYAAACEWIGMKLVEPASLEETRLAAKLSENLGNKNLLEKYAAKLK